MPITSVLADPDGNRFCVVQKDGEGSDRALEVGSGKAVLDGFSATFPDLLSPAPAFAEIEQKQSRGNALPQSVGLFSCMARL